MEGEANGNVDIVVADGVMVRSWARGLGVLFTVHAMADMCVGNFAFKSKGWAWGIFFLKNNIKRSNLCAFVRCGNLKIVAALLICAGCVHFLKI